MEAEASRAENVTDQPRLNVRRQEDNENQGEQSRPKIITLSESVDNASRLQ